MVVRRSPGARVGVHRRNRERVAAVKRRIGQALVFVAVFLIIVADVQRIEDAEAVRANRQLYGALDK